VLGNERYEPFIQVLLLGVMTMGRLMLGAVRDAAMKRSHQGCYRSALKSVSTLCLGPIRSYARSFDAGEGSCVNDSFDGLLC
jgi:hypothetical protein